MPPYKRIEFSDLSPSEKARWEITGLASDPETMEIFQLEDLVDEEEIAEHKQRAELYLEKKVAIIKKYGVEEEYLAPLLKERARLWQELVKVSREMEAIRA